jgi:hypothetical protein
MGEFVDGEGRRNGNARRETDEQITEFIGVVLEAYALAFSLQR